MKKLMMLFVLGAAIMGMCAPASADNGVVRQVWGQLSGAVRSQINKYNNKQATEESDSQGQSADQEGKIGALILSKGGLMGIVREELVAAFNSLKESYKQEGIAYARELGDIMAERIVHNAKVQSTIGMIKMLVWSVVIYITIVTLLLLIVLLKLSKSNRRILELLEKTSAHEARQP